VDTSANVRRNKYQVDKIINYLSDLKNTLIREFLFGDNYSENKIVPLVSVMSFDNYACWIQQSIFIDQLDPDLIFDRNREIYGTRNACEAMALLNDALQRTTFEQTLKSLSIENGSFIYPMVIWLTGGSFNDGQSGSFKVIAKALRDNWGYSEAFRFAYFVGEDDIRPIVREEFAALLGNERMIRKLDSDHVRIITYLIECLEKCHRDKDWSEFLYTANKTFEAATYRNEKYLKEYEEMMPCSDDFNFLDEPVQEFDFLEGDLEGFEGWG
jgi:hypothetical protein